MAIAVEELEQLLVARTYHVKGLMRSREILLSAIGHMREKLDPASKAEIDKALKDADAALTNEILNA